MALSATLLYERFFHISSLCAKKIYAGKNLVWQLCAILLTYILVVSEFDWLYFISVRNTTINQLFFPALIIGGFLPVIIPTTLILLGMVRKSRKMLVLGWALGQAAFLGWAISSFYKAFTGRMQPNLHDLVTNSSNDFHFGILEHGIFWGWPSSHTAVAFAVAFAFIALIPKNKKYSRYASVAYALYRNWRFSFSPLVFRIRSRSDYWSCHRKRGWYGVGKETTSSVVTDNAAMVLNTDLLKQNFTG